MSSANFITLLAACLSVAVQGYKLSRFENLVCPVNAAGKLGSCMSRVHELSQIDFDPELCRVLRESMRCVDQLIIACLDSPDPEFLKTLGSYDITGGRIFQLCRALQ
ncbi:uncharacterized protein LOC112555220 [Pomacea canaliculata]|uniref:uncharacterized protein LOC112555220 n=1 Tax=Pomacea canaliculata TaxID=400727 RepID=UPI000D73100B|nr:uncharacterized protein LOC112555220 [Pomacea canaliculata]